MTSTRALFLRGRRYFILLRKAVKDFNAKIGFAVLSIVLSILLGVLLPPVLGLFTDSAGNKITITVGEQIVISISLFVAISFFEFLYFYNQSLQHLRHEYRIWEIKEKGDKVLYDIRASFERVVNDARSADDLFVLHFDKEFKNLSKKISEVARKKELFVASNYFLNAENVLKAFKTENKGVWRYVWIIENVDEPLFKEPEWAQFIEKTAKMVENGKMEAIYSIIVLGKQELGESERVKKLLDFFKTNNCIDCRLISKDNYSTICERNSVNKGYDDFGLYDDQLLFVERYEGHQITGSFSKDPAQIEDYMQLFSSLWDATSITGENPSTQTTKITVNELIKFDLNYAEDSTN
jgi:DNA-binding PadR family transcriptional regulator